MGRQIVIVGCVIVAVLGYVGPALAAVGPCATNMDLLGEAVEKAVEHALSDVEIAADQVDVPLLLTAQTNHSGNWLVAHMLAEHLLARGFRVALDSTRMNSGANRFSYRVLDFRVIGRKKLFHRQLTRRALASVAFRFTQGDVLAWQSEYTEYVTDSIPRGRLDLLESHDYAFARTDLKMQSWGQFIEPVIISTMLGGLTYTFFSNR